MPEPRVHRGHPYRVSEGDTLTSIAYFYTKDAAKYDDIWRLNPQIENPDLIRAGETIYLPWPAPTPVTYNGRNVDDMTREEAIQALRELETSRRRMRAFSYAEARMRAQGLVR